MPKHSICLWDYIVSGIIFIPFDKEYIFKFDTIKIAFTEPHMTSSKNHVIWLHDNTNMYKIIK